MTPVTHGKFVPNLGTSTMSITIFTMDFVSPSPFRWTEEVVTVGHGGVIDLGRSSVDCTFFVKDDLVMGTLKGKTLFCSLTRGLPFGRVIVVSINSKNIILNSSKFNKFYII